MNSNLTVLSWHCRYLPGAALVSATLVSAALASEWRIDVDVNLRKRESKFSRSGGFIVEGASLTSELCE